MSSKKPLLKLPDGKRRLVERLGYSFKDLSLVETALSHRSVGAHNN
jgi:dsRNA-specific ribonuclease